MIDVFRSDIEKAGYRFDGPILADNQWHRCYFGDEKKSSGRYRLKIVDAKFAIGNYGSDKDPECSGGWKSWHNKIGTKAYSPEERKAYREKAEAEKKAVDAAREKYQELLARRLQKLYAALPEADAGMDYLYRKKLGTHGVKRRALEELVIPIYQIDGRLWNLQKILPGFKGFCKGAKIKGGFFPFGEYKSGPLIIAEGWATAASVFQAIGISTFAAFTAGNLEPVALALKNKHPGAEIIIAADNDMYTKNAKGEHWNPGIEAGIKAATAVSARCVWPEFPDISSRPTDFNDLHLLYGLAAVKNKIGGE